MGDDTWLLIFLSSIGLVLIFIGVDKIINDDLAALDERLKTKGDSWNR